VVSGEWGVGSDPCSPPSEECPVGVGWFLVSLLITLFVPATTPSGFACHPSGGGEWGVGRGEWGVGDVCSLSPALPDGGSGFLIVDFMVKNKEKSLSSDPLTGGELLG
jgi:hypothetical protein